MYSVRHSAPLKPQTLSLSLDPVSLWSAQRGTYLQRVFSYDIVLVLRRRTERSLTNFPPESVVNYKAAPTH